MTVQYLRAGRLEGLQFILDSIQEITISILQHIVDNYVMEQLRFVLGGNVIGLSVN